MKLHFDSKQEFLLEAGKGIINIFKEQLLNGGDNLKTNTVLQMRELILRTRIKMEKETISKLNRTF